MRSWMWFIVVAISLCAPTAQAGAWLREKGTTFTSVTFTTSWFRDTTSATYLEYGLRDNVTIGADIGTATSHFGLQTGYGTLFIRRPIGKTDGPSRWAYELGLGAAWINDLILPTAKAGLSWGRGIELREKSGWIAVDSSINWEFSTGERLAKLDTTVGLNFTEVTTGMVQLFIANLDGNTYASIAPSLLFKPRKGKFKIQIGTESLFSEPENTAFKFGIWREF